jgi:hypothetical protein
VGVGVGVGVSGWVRVWVWTRMSASVRVCVCVHAAVPSSCEGLDLPACLAWVAAASVRGHVQSNLQYAGKPRSLTLTPPPHPRPAPKIAASTASLVLTSSAAAPRPWASPASSRIAPWVFSQGRPARARPELADLQSLSASVVPVRHALGPMGTPATKDRAVRYCSVH